MRLSTGLLCFALLLTPLLARAEQDVWVCNALINGKIIEVDYTDIYDEYIDNTTLREIALENWDGSCPSYVVLAQLTPELSAEERSVFCLEHDNEQGYFTGYAEGERDAYGKCATPGKFCKVVNTSKEEAIAVASAMAGATAGTATATAAAGVTAVAHSSGAVILTGTSGYIAGTLGTVGASVVSALTAPAVIAGAAVSVVAVGAAVYVCQ